MQKNFTNQEISNYYCNQKFWNFSVNVERQEINSCCSAEYQKIDTKWLENNPTKLFNTPDVLSERQKMLDNERVSSCNICWKTEENNILSRRQMMDGVEKNFTHINSYPKEISLFLGISCNLTCSYCCKEYSTAWLRDINTNGVYFENDNRFKINSFDKIILKLGQKTIQSSKNYNLILDAISFYKAVDTVSIVGGEPFLQNKLVDVVNKFEKNVAIFTGLGVNPDRFSKILSQLQRNNISLDVSGENINEFYEFNRYGNSFANFLKNLKTIRDFKINFKFHSVLSNTTIFGFENFLKYFENDEIEIHTCMDPNYLSPSVIDEESKNKICNLFYGKHTKTVHNLVSGNYDPVQKQMFKNYITEFSKRRNLNLKIFPQNFLNWIYENY